ncbi:hypothetical protein BJ875DRAFT_538652 [Amylocarpus encephaloides]|uniref:Uncharacterized protein n=1 Tax=Amylocarpus encephaloides TaxID=45428 RepID=A0A9P7YT99_9HELO|nr:hypothetical protein BJ875DRAFT_538652 [Amylocarpus encephaloides]
MVHWSNKYALAAVGKVIEWLSPKKREVKKRSVEGDDEMFNTPTPANFAVRKAVETRNKAPLDDEIKEKLEEGEWHTCQEINATKKNAVKGVPTPSISNMDDGEGEEALSMTNFSGEGEDELANPNGRAMYTKALV